MTTKLTGAFVVPVIVVAVVAVRRHVGVLTELAAAAVAGGAVATMSYSVAGSDAGHAVRYMIEKQTAHHVGGHVVEVAGRTHLHPPWWTHLWFQTQSYRVPVTVAIVLLVVVALVAGPRPIGRFMLAAMLVPIVVLGFAVGFALPFYYLVWQPMLMALTGLGVGALWRRGVPHRLLAVTAVAPMLVLGIQTSGDVLRLRHSGYDLLADTPLRASVPDIDSVVLVLGVADRVAAVFEPGQPVLTRIPPGEHIGAVVVDCAFARRHRTSPVLRYVEEPRRAFALTRVEDLLVFVPADDRSAAQPVGSVLALCASTLARGSAG